MNLRRPPIGIQADMMRNGLKAPAGAEYLGARVDGGSRVLLWQLEDRNVIEQRCPIVNLTVLKRRGRLRIVK